MDDRRTVLVVEDDAALRGLLAAALEDEGYAVLEAADGRLALRLATEHEPSLVLTDLLLPDMSGLDLIERLRSSPLTRNTPIILATGLGAPGNSAGVEPNSVLTKPFDLDVLLAHVEHLSRLTSSRVAG